MVRPNGTTSAVVVLKHETSTLRQRHIFISIDFKFGVGDYVREVTNPDKVGSGSMNHDYDTGVTLSDSINKTCVKPPLRRNHDDVISAHSS